MLVFPSAKINLGLSVIEKRSDGFHNIETVFYPINWCDALEVIEGGRKIQIELSGLTVAGKTEDNLLFKVWKEIKKHRELPSVKIHLHKNIPMGAGLGGGSSDAAFLLNLLDKKFELALSTELKKEIASKIGSDCAFFLENKPVFAWEKGDKFSPVSVKLSKYYILVIYPGIHSNTAEAYNGIVPSKRDRNPREIIASVPLGEWKKHLQNDFEKSIFKKYSLISSLKNSLYENGALYASMSGSGSSVYGIFNEEPDGSLYKDFRHFLQHPEN